MSWRWLFDRVVVGALALSLASPVVAFAQDSKETDLKVKDSKSSDAKEKDPKEKDPKGEKPAAGKSADGKKDDEGPGFGAGRKPGSTKDSKSTTKDSKSTSKAEKVKSKGPLSPEEREKKKIVDDITKQLRKAKDDSFVVFQVVEQRWERRQIDGTPPEKQPIDQRFEGEIKVLEGKQKTIDYLAEYIGEYPPATSRSKKKVDKSAIPDPIRRFTILGIYEGTPEGNRTAHALQEAKQTALDKQLTVENERGAAKGGN